jgi:hypothetical protein
MREIFGIPAVTAQVAMSAMAAVVKLEMMAAVASTMPAASEIPAGCPPLPDPELCHLAGGPSNR